MAKEAAAAVDVLQNPVLQINRKNNLSTR